jgi:hypothetical protein
LFLMVRWNSHNEFSSRFLLVESRPIHHNIARQRQEYPSASRLNRFRFSMTRYSKTS